LVAALSRHGGHRERTAESLGLSRRTLQYKLKKYGLSERRAGHLAGHQVGQGDED
jgi:DNA-binding NtrC family response regulator